MFYKGNIENLTIKNKSFRKILYTTDQMQLVMMSLKPNQEIGMESHPRTTQFIRVEKGEAIAYLDGKKRVLRDGSALVIPAGVYHNIINSGEEDCKLYSIYSPPEHVQ